MNEADEPKTERDTSVPAAAVPAAVRAAGVQAVAAGLAFAAYLVSRPFDRHSQGPTASMLLTALVYCGVSWLALAAAGRRAFAWRPPPAEPGPQGSVRLAASPETVAAWGGGLAGAAYATAVLLAAGPVAFAAGGLVDSAGLVRGRFLGLDTELATFLGAFLFVAWSGQTAAARLAASRRSAGPRPQSRPASRA